MYRLDRLQGQPRASTLLQEILLSQTYGRTYILAGPRGSGKMTAALGLAAALLGDNLFNDPDLSFYRNDAYSLKTRWFLQRAAQGKNQEQAADYLQLLLARAGRAVQLGELKNSVHDLLLETQDMLRHTDWPDQLRTDSPAAKSLLEISEDLESKKKLSIGYIRSLISDHEQKPGRSLRISILGDFELASVEAQNAVLKLLEEPPATSLLLLTASQPSLLLPTIRSRAIMLEFSELTPVQLEAIMGTSFPHTRSTVSVMEEELFHRRLSSREKVTEFFRDIAPRVQFGSDLFRFLDEITDESGEESALSLLREITLFLGELNQAAQLLSRTRQLPAGGYYQDLTRNLAGRIDSEVLYSWVQRCTDLLPLIQKGNIRSKMVLPDLLISLARWYQQAAGRA